MQTKHVRVSPEFLSDSDGLVCSQRWNVCHPYVISAPSVQVQHYSLAGAFPQLSSDQSTNV